MLSTAESSRVQHSNLSLWLIHQSTSFSCHRTTITSNSHQQIFWNISLSHHKTTITPQSQTNLSKQLFCIPRNHNQITRSKNSQSTLYAGPTQPQSHHTDTNWSTKAPQYMLESYNHATESLQSMINQSIISPLSPQNHNLTKQSGEQVITQYWTFITTVIERNLLRNTLLNNPLLPPLDLHSNLTTLFPH